MISISKSRESLVIFIYSDCSHDISFFNFCLLSSKLQYSLKSMWCCVRTQPLKQSGVRYLLKQYQVFISLVFNTAVDSLCQYKIYITSVFLNILPRRRNLFTLKFDPMRYPKIDIFDPLIFIVLEGLSHDWPKLEDSPPSNPKVPVNVSIFHSGNV